MKKNNIRLAGVLFPVIAGLAATACLFPSPFRSGSRPPYQTSTAQGRAPIPARAMDPDSKSDELKQEAFGRIKARDFAWLEDTANEARKSKERFPGGYWKLYSIYEGVTLAGGSDEDWQSHLALLQEWKEAYPDSITAKVAIANTWLAYAWNARGGGYVNTVSDANFRLFDQRVAEAKKELLSVGDTKRVCPQWYGVMLGVGLADGMEKEEFDRIYEEGFALEPTYYLLQRVKATYLLPRWNGEEGDWVKFADETAHRLGGGEGKILYFQFAGSMQPIYRQEIFRANDIHWEKVKEGYEVLKKTYGVDNYRANQFAALAFFAEDYPTAKAALAELGEKWNPEVWRTKDHFDSAKALSENRLQVPERIAKTRGAGRSQP